MAGKTLTINELNSEYQSWVQANGQGRNKQDLRFGQYIWIHYDMDSICKDRNAGTDGFGAERAEKAYTQIMQQLTNQ